jgi:hypothetical protein
MKWVIPILVILAVILVSGCVSSIKDCGNDADCFFQEAKVCNPARALLSEGSQGAEISLELITQNSDTGSCLFTVKVVDITLPLELAELGVMFDEMEGKSMTCQFPMEMMESMGESASVSTIFTALRGIKDDFECTGNLKEGIESAESIGSNF